MLVLSDSSTMYTTIGNSNTFVVYLVTISGPQNTGIVISFVYPKCRLLG